MNKISTDSHQSHSVDEEAMAKLKYKTLLEGFLANQKDFVSKKRKVQDMKEKRDSLRAEIGFLRRRYRDLFDIRTLEADQKSSRIRVDVNAIKQNLVSDQLASKNFSPVTETNTLMANKAGNTQVEEGLILQPGRMNKKPKRSGVKRVSNGKKTIVIGEEDNARMQDGIDLSRNNKRKGCLSNGKRSGNKKITWNDQKS